MRHIWLPLWPSVQRSSAALQHLKWSCKGCRWAGVATLRMASHTAMLDSLFNICLQRGKVSWGAQCTLP